MRADIQEEVQEMNLAYLLLVQRLIREDRATALFRLKLDDDMADLLVSLNARQLSRLSRINQLLCRPCFDDVAQVHKLIADEREPGLAQTHAALLLAGKDKSRSQAKQGKAKS